MKRLERNHAIWLAGIMWERAREGDYSLADEIVERGRIDTRGYFLEFSCAGVKVYLENGEGDRAILVAQCGRKRLVKRLNYGRGSVGA